MDRRCVLYIPHGSDERFRKIEITKTCEFFISHMVQMKEVIIRKKLTEEGLYIPHGSDESEPLLDDKVILTVLYIPHGSDESVAQQVSFLF